MHATTTSNMWRAIRAIAAGALLTMTATAQVSVDYLNFAGGGSGEVAVDDSGCLYVVGGFGDALVSAPGSPCGTGPAVAAAWVAKLDPSGAILWSRRLDAAAHAIAVDRAGANVYVGGFTGTPLHVSGFPTAGYDPTLHNGADGFVGRFDGATGCPISYTFFGYHVEEGAIPHGLAVDDATGDVHVVGMTPSMTFVTTATIGGYLPPATGWTAFAVGFDATLATRRYFVYLPGSPGFDNARDVAVDATGIYIAGCGRSAALTFVPQRVGPGGNLDAFVMKLDPTASTLIYGTFVGGSDDEAVQGANQVAFQEQGTWLAVDGLGQVTLTSWTTSSDFPTTDGSSGLRKDNVFVTKLSASGGGPLYSTLIGGNGYDVSSGIARDTATGHVYVAGSTRSREFPTPGLITQYNNRYDAFVIEVDDATGAVLTGTFLGGSGDDDVWGGVAAGAPGSLYVSGRASGGFQPPPTSTLYASGAYVAKLHFGPVAPTPGITVTPTAGLVTTEAGGTDAFTVVLDTQPSAVVSIDVWTDDATEGLVSAGAQGPATTVTLTFDAVTWSQPQTVTVHGQDDSLLDGDVAYTLVTDPAVSADPDYALADAADVSATNLDNEVPAGIAVTGIAPSWMNAGTSISVTIDGAGFQSGATVSLEGGGGPAPAASDVVVVSGSTITATLTASGGGPKGTHTWDVRVTNPDASTGVLAGGFQVIK